MLWYLTVLALSASDEVLLQDEAATNRKRSAQIVRVSSESEEDGFRRELLWSAPAGLVAEASPRRTLGMTEFERRTGFPEGAVIALRLLEEQGGLRLIVVQQGRATRTGIWNGDTGVRTAVSNEEFVCYAPAAIAPNAAHIAVSDGEDIVVRDAATGAFRARLPVKRLHGHEQGASAVAFLSGGRVVSGGWSGEHSAATIYNWVFHTGELQELGRSRGGGYARISSVDVAPDQSAVGAAQSTAGRLYVWMEQGRPPVFVGKAVSAVAFSRDGNRLGACAGRSLVVYDTTKWVVETEIEFLDRRINATAFSPCGQVLFAAGTKGIHVADVSAGELVQVLRRPRGNDAAERGQEDAEVVSIAVSPDGKRLAAGGANGQVDLWELHIEK